MCRRSFVLFVIVTIGAATRLGGLGQHSFWYDEAVTAVISRASVPDILLGKSRDRGNPPLSSLAAKIGRISSGDRDVAYRLLFALFGIATIPLIYLLGRQLASREVGELTALLFALAPLSLELSTEARAYSLVHFMSVLNTLAFVCWIERQSRPRAVLYALSLACMCLTHYYAVFLVMAQALAVLLVKGKPRLQYSWGLLVVLAAVLSSFWLPAFFSQITDYGNLVRYGDRWYYQFLATPLGLFMGRLLVWRESGLGMLAFASLALLSSFWIAVAVGVASFRRSASTCVLLVAWLALPIVLPACAALIGKPCYHIRAASIALPAGVLLAAAGLTTLGVSQRRCILGVLAILVAIAHGNFFSGRPLKDDWRAAVPAITNCIESESVLVFDTDYEVRSYLHYAVRDAVVPGSMVGIVAGPTSDGRLEGVSWRNGERQESAPSDKAREVLTSPSVWLVLCVPATPPEMWVSFFAHNGYDVETMLDFYRIRAIHFRGKNTHRRNATPVRSTGG